MKVINNNGVNVIEHKNDVYAIIIKAEYEGSGVNFFTEDCYSQQLAQMNHLKGSEIDAHIHNHETRNVIQTQEVLVIRKGRLRVDFYEQEKNYIGSVCIKQGDVILLAMGGHGFKVMEDTDMIEIKQGPYLGKEDKLRFDGIEDEEVVLFDLV